MTAIAQLRRHRELGVGLLLKDFVNATPKTRDEILARWEVWYRGLLSLVEPLGDGVAAQFEPLTPMLPKEQATVAHCPPLDDHFNMIRACHAVCMYRLGKLFQKFPPVMPEAAEPATGAGGRPRYERPGLIEAVEAELSAQTARGEPRNKAAAYRAGLAPLGLRDNEQVTYTNWL